MKEAFPLESIFLDRSSAVQLHRQLYGQLRRMIEERNLQSGTILLSTRALAASLGLGRNTVIAAYDQLALEGFIAVAPDFDAIETVHGVGYRWKP